jgi:hypothetical protein
MQLSEEFLLYRSKGSVCFIILLVRAIRGNILEYELVSCLLR